MANLSSKTGTITTPVQTQISLANNATTSVQDMSAYDAQEVMGFVYVDATADLRAYFTVTVVKNGAGTYEIAGADIAGDQSGTGASAIAPVSFSMSGSILQATLPNITGFASAYLRYQLSAPYLGGNYPLTVSATQVAGNAAGTAPVAGYIGEKLTFTARTVSAVTSGVTANASVLTTLTPGVWLINWYVSGAVAASTTGHGAFISTNSSNDTTGNIHPDNVRTEIADAAFGARLTGLIHTYAVNSSTPIYAKAISYGANRNVTIGGEAVRIA